MRIREALIAGRLKRSEDGWAATTTAIIMGVVAAAGAATSAYGSYAAGQAQKSAAKFNAEVANNNATMAVQQANADATKIRDRNRRLAGTQRAALAKSGVNLSGSGEDVMYDSAIQGELDALTTIYKGHVEGVNYHSQASLDTFQGNSAYSAGLFSAGGSLLSGAGSMAQAYGNYQSIKANPKFKT